MASIRLVGFAPSRKESVVPDPRLILRFRDFSADVGTVAAHNAIIEAHGAVLWGWWRKAHEPDRATELSSLIDTLPLQVLILNRHTELAYRTTCYGIYQTVRRKRQTLVPEYYRHATSEVARWFEFRDPILATEYDSELARLMGEQTLLIEGWDDQEDLAPIVVVHTSPDVNTVAPETTGSKDLAGDRSVPCIDESRIRIVHISDLHFSLEEHNFDFPGLTGLTRPMVTMADAIDRDYHDCFADMKPSALVISGDITSKANWEPGHQAKIVDQIKDLMSRLGVEPSGVLLTPGNHDFNRPAVGRTVNAPDVNIRGATRFAHETDFRVFRNLLLGTAIVDPLSACYVWSHPNFDVKIGLLNSANLAPTDFVEYGFVGDHLDSVLEQMGEGEKPAYKILVLHHHLVPIAYVEEAGERSVSVTLDAHLLLNKAQRHGVQIVLHGHQHIPKVIKTSQMLDDDDDSGLTGDDVYIFASGSAGSRYLQDGNVNTYTVLDFSVEGVQIECRELDRHGNPGKRRFRVGLNIQPKGR